METSQRSGEKEEFSKEKTGTKAEPEQGKERKQHSAQSTGYYINRPVFGNSGPSKLRRQLSQGMAFCLVIVVCILFYFALLRLDKISGVIRIIIGILKPIIYGLGLAYLLNPIVKFVERYLEQFLMERFPEMKKVKPLCRGVGIFAAVLVMVMLIVTLCNMMIPELYQSIKNMIVTVPSQLNDAMKSITEMLSKDTTLGQFATSVLEEVTSFVQNWMRSDLLKQVNVVMSNLTVGVINVISELVNAVIGVIISIYVLWGKEKFSQQSKKIVYALFQPNHANMILHLTIKSNEIFGGFIIGKIVDSLIIGALCFVGLSVLNMPYTMLVSVIVGVTNVIPFFGPYIGAIPSLILITLSNPMKGLYFLIFILVLQQLDGNVIGPKILGDSTGLSAFWVVFSILLGGGLFGFVGMILGVPTFAVIYYVVGMLVNQELEKKKLPTDTACYDEMSYVDSDGTYVHSEENEFNKNKGE